MADQAGPYFQRLQLLTFPLVNISLGLLESDSRDGTYEAFARGARRSRHRFRDVQIWRKDFGYQIPSHLPRWDPTVQADRRAILARSRNHLLFLGMRDADWVLWLDADVTEFPGDIIQRLLAFGKDIMHPHCVTVYGGPTFDCNGWSHRGEKHLHDHRGDAELVPLTSVGGTMLLVRADCHRDGLIFPPYFYGTASALAREANGMTASRGEIETEGLGLMAADMNLQCWGAPNLEILHRNR